MKKFVILLSMATPLLSTGVALANNALIEGEGPLLDEAADDYEIDLTEAFTSFLDTVGTVQPEKAKVKSTVTIGTSGIMPMAFGDHGAAWGDCHYYTTPEGVNQYRCIDQGTANDIYSVGIADVDHNYLIACRSTNGGATYTLVGYVMVITGDRNLVVYGNSFNNTIGIIRYRNTALPGTACDFYNFQPWFSSLTIDGRLGNDEIWGSQFNDTSLKGEKVYGWEGNDVLYGQSNNGVTGAQLMGGSGSDEFYSTSPAVAGQDQMYGHLSSSELGVGTCENQNNDDRFYISDTSALIVAGFGNDYVYSYGPSILAWGFTNAYTGENMNPYVWGGFNGCDEDFIWGSNVFDKIDGGPDQDYIYGNGGDDALFGGGAAQYPNLVLVEDKWDHIYGGSGNDNIWGGFLDEEAFELRYIQRRSWVWAGSGNDTFHGSYGIDHVDCGSNAGDYCDGSYPDPYMMTNQQVVDWDKCCGCATYIQADPGGCFL